MYDWSIFHPVQGTTQNLWDLQDYNIYSGVFTGSQNHRIDFNALLCWIETVNDSDTELSLRNKIEIFEM